MAQPISGPRMAVLSADTTADIERRQERFLRLAAIRIGVDATRRVYPEAAQLSDLRRLW